ncbi:MAG: YqaJ viral recombinase family protein [Gammaproteobacteria bacterium AqS3]|nr:YqaJ viral recombinase family protein [Gammaproteobacteria bacterium AqS3]
MQLNAVEIEGVEQRSEEWYRLRRGRLSGSTIGALLGTSSYKNRDSLMSEMLDELTGNIPERDENDDMRRGIEWEDAIRDAGVAETFGRGSVALISHTEAFWLDEAAGICYSPDGLLDMHGHLYLIEVKAPRKLSTFGSIPPWHYPQVALGMEILRCPACLYIEGLVRDNALSGLRCVQVDYDPGWWPQVEPLVQDFQNDLSQALQLRQS